MNRDKKWLRVGLSCALVVIGGAAGCTDDIPADLLYKAADGGDRLPSDRDADTDAAVDGGDPSVVSTVCVPAVASDHLPARSNVMERVATASASGVFTADLFGLFQSNCGGCHVDNSLGGFQVSLTTFSTVVGEEALARLTSDDPKYFMPPSNRKPFSELSKGDPLVELSTLLEAWIAAGKPTDVFYPESAASGGNDVQRYLLTKQVGTQMTNLANCIPAASMVRGAAKAENEALDELDAMFAKATELPERLEDTDLVTLDAEQLARNGVVAFAPAYTLWADNAKKIRLVRTPRGKAITFDEQKQRFDIPANTRFYKTFFKRVVDMKGNESYRKMETRLILSRPDKTVDGAAVPTALFGTYAWNEAETEAVLVRDPLRNGAPFRDRVFSYVTDEHAAEDVITDAPDNLEEALKNAGLVRTYGIPGSERCIQCHMGAPMQNFVLGFTPLQLHRRPLGEGGVVEPAKRDELNQLQRLIDYGLIEGMASPDDVTRLEDSQGDRKPRNDHELAAQGYMLGNCAHCHNPRGFPSVIAPELRDVLDFMPSAHGGIFQFPLEKFSPRIFRGVYQNVPQPYITPGLYDRPPATTLDDGTDVGTSDGSNYLAKQINYIQDELRPLPPKDLLAPWRSLIYRNVDAPFTYEEDFSIYPRMPMNTPGYDCRVRQLLGSWMVSIPSRMKETPEYQAGQVTELFLTNNHPAAQPYVEVLPDDAEFSRQARIAESNVRRFQQSERYAHCPDPTTVDIVDPSVISGDRLVPGPYTHDILDGDGNLIGAYSVRAPEQPHYAVTDLTNPPGDWFPRRPDWVTLLVDGEIDGVLDPELRRRIDTLRGVARDEDGDEIKIGPGIKIGVELRATALEEVYFGLWQVKDGCDFSKQKKVGDIPPDERPRWMQREAPKASAPVYSISPGAEVFTQICQNCHGPEGDSKGRLAATIADMTGGQTRVANLRDGLFGPLDDPRANRKRIFGEHAGDGVTAEDWAARYLMFMGLGGTQRVIPTPALQTIRNGTVLGEKRYGSASLDVSSANMLSVPLALCKAVLPGTLSNFVPWEGSVDYSSTAVWKSPLIARNGDVELWQKLCVVDNEALPVRVVRAALKTSAVATYEVGSLITGGMRLASTYPPTAKVGDHRGGVHAGIEPGNEAPWCMAKPTDPALLVLVENEWATHAAAGVDLPYCPAEFLAPGKPDDGDGMPETGEDDDSNWFTEKDAERWATRGAMNAGMSVFLYLDALARGDKQHPVPYDRCEEL